MFAKIAVISMLFAVAAADSIKVKQCDSNSTQTLSLEWDECKKSETAAGSPESWTKLTLTSGNVENKTAVAAWTTYTNNQCTVTNGISFILRCECEAGDSFRLMCDAAAGVIPSAILIIAAIMAHLF